MDLSNYVYDVFEELKRIEKNSDQDAKKKCEELVRMLRTVEETNYLLQTKNEAIKLYLKTLKSEKDKRKHNLEVTQNEIDRIRENTLLMSKEMKSKKDLGDEIVKEYDDKMKKAEEQIKVIRDTIIEKSKFDPEKLKELKKENEDLRKDLQAIIDEIKDEEGVYQKKMVDLKDEFETIGKTDQVKLQQANQFFGELEMLKMQKKLLETKIASSWQKMEIFENKIPDFKKIMDYKDTQYKKYRNDIKEIIDRGYYSYLEMKEVEQFNKEVNSLFMSLITENESLEKELQKERKKTEKIKEQCKKVREQLIAKAK